MPTRKNEASETPDDPAIEALRLRSILSHQGLLDDVDRHRLLAAPQILPGQQGASGLTRGATESSSEALGMIGLRVQLAAEARPVGRCGTKEARALRKRVLRMERALGRCGRELGSALASWPPQTNQDVMRTAQLLDNAAAELTTLDPSDLGLATETTLRSLKTALARASETFAERAPAPDDLTLKARHRLGGLGPKLTALRRIGYALGLRAEDLAQLRPPRFRPRTVSPEVVATAREAQSRGDVAASWRALAKAGDKYSENAAKIVESPDQPPNLFGQIVIAHWDRVVGPKVRAEKFGAVARNQLANYLDRIESRRLGRDYELPDTQSIEVCYRRAVEAEGLPPRLAIDSVISKLDLMLDESPTASVFGLANLSWGSMLGLEADRLSFSSRAFDDVDMPAMREFLATALATVKQFGLEVKVGDGLELLANASGALITGQPPNGIRRTGPPDVQGLKIGPRDWTRARAFLDQGELSKAWAVLHDAGDGYAHYPYLALKEAHRPRSLLAQVVHSHWDRILGPGAREHFEPVNARFLASYLRRVEADDGVLPDTRQIESMYRDAVEAAGLPAAVVPDAVMSRLSDGSPGTPLNWGAMLGMARERTVAQSGVFADLDVEPLKELFADNIHWIVQRNVRMPFGETARMTWTQIRNFF